MSMEGDTEGLPSGLSDLLTKVAELRVRKEAAEEALKAANAELDAHERLALEALGVSGLDGCRVAGRTWWMQDSLRLSVNADQKAAVLKAAKKYGIAAEITTVATATLKAWLSERAKQGKRAKGASFVAGTAFEGLVTEHVETSLRSRSLG
jgi:hypothetical protein